MELTLKWLRDHGYAATKTEHWNHYAKRRQDLFGFIDVLAANDHHLLGIQVSDDSHVAQHRGKVLENKVAQLLACHMAIEIWSWGLRLTGERRKDGKLNRRKEMTLKREQLTAQLLALRTASGWWIGADSRVHYGSV
jgi:hypothetical protein